MRLLARVCPALLALLVLLSSGSLRAASVGAPLPATDPVLVGAGDIADCSSPGAAATADLLDSIPGTVFTAGDNAYPDGSDSNFANCYAPTWGQHKARTRPALGNHDYQTPGAQGYFTYFGPAAGDPRTGYYSYDLGTWHIVVLNSQDTVAAGSSQEQWLRNDLATHRAACTLAYWHYPRFSSGGSDATMTPLWQALYDAHADVVLSAHNHNYERFVPQNPDGESDATRGIREFVVGTGGAEHHMLGTPIANSEIHDDTTFGVLKLTLHNTSYNWQFIPEAGKNFTDAGGATCHTNRVLLPLLTH